MEESYMATEGRHYAHIGVFLVVPATVSSMTMVKNTNFLAS